MPRRASTVQVGTAGDQTVKVEQAASVATTNSANTEFTFVDQAADLTSLSNKRITNREQRHVIRSHVMRGVRQTEADQGRKRANGREAGKKMIKKEVSSEKLPTSSVAATTSASTTPSISISRPPSRPQLPKEDPSISERSSQTAPDQYEPSSPPRETQAEKVEPKSVESDVKPLLEIKSHTRFLGASPTTYCPAVTMLDPFTSPPSPKLKIELVDSLLQYCFTCFLPMTFPLERKRTSMILERKGAVLQVRSHMEATFLGLLVTLSAHRAIYHGRHQDLTPSDRSGKRVVMDQAYHLSKQEALLVLRAKLVNGVESTMDAFQACYGVLAAAVLLGEFNEARMHLQGIQTMLRNMYLPPSAADWVHRIDVVSAIGLLSKPLIPISWPREVIPAETLLRAVSYRFVQNTQLLSGFSQIENISSELRSLLPAAASICQLCEYNERSPEGLTNKEHLVLGKKVLELLYDLTSYVYDAFPVDSDHSNEVSIPPLEALVRLAVIGLVHTSTAVVPPSGGVGRAMTYRQKRATDVWLQLNHKQSRDGTHRIDISELRLLLWIFFIFTERAAGQFEERFFLGLVVQYVRDLWLMNMQEIETTLSLFLDVPSVKGSAWRKIWRDVQVYRQLELRP